MGRKLRFTKMQGAGNDYVYIDCFSEPVHSPEELAKKISDRHFGVGSDGLVLILPSAKADARMRMFNADGSEAEMCGNASRCVGKYLYEHGLVNKHIVRVETLAGVRVLRLDIEDGEVVAVTVDMGEPILNPSLIPMIGPKDRCVGESFELDGESWKITAVSMGTPHAVIFAEGIDALDLPTIGPKFENWSIFPQKVNTEFVEILSRTRIRMRVWERGAGETLACGTGACAAAVAAMLNGLTERSVAVELRGGTLSVSWDENDNHVYMTGPAETVFEGEYFY